MNLHKAPAMGKEAWLLLITLSILWGGSFFFAEIALRQLPPFTLVLARVAIAAVTLLAIIHLTGQRMPKDSRLWISFFGMGLLNNCIPFALIFWGQLSIASGLASILNATTPLFTVVLAHFMTANEKLTAMRFVGVILGIIGVAIMIGPEFISGFTDNILAQFAILGAAFSYGIATIFGRRFEGEPPMITAAGQLTASTIILLPLVVLFEPVPDLSALTISVTLSTIGLALLSTSLAYILYFRILKIAGATNIALVTFLIPVSAIGLGVLILGEALNIQQIIGMTLIALGLAAIDGRLFHNLRRVFQ